MGNNIWSKECAFPMKSIYYLIGLISIIVGLGVFILANGNNENNLLSSGSTDYQEIIISYKNYNYYPQVVEVEIGKPVRIYLDSSVKGCFRQFVIRKFNVNKYLKTPSDYIEFTPNKIGTYPFQCGMGMGTGEIIVK